MRPFLQFYTIEEAHQILVKLRSSKGGGGRGGGGLGCNWSIVGNASNLTRFQMKTSYCRNLKTKTLLQVIEIIPWKVRTNDFYSRSICDASKKITSEHSKRVFFFSLHCNEWIKIIEAISMVRCFYFMHTNLISHFNANKRLWMYIFRPIRDTNKSTSRSNFQYVWDKYYYAYIFFRDQNRYIWSEPQ